MQTYVAACQDEVTTAASCDNLLIVDCTLNCEKKGVSFGETCDYEPCKQGQSCWQNPGQGQQGPGAPKSCGQGCKYGSTGYYMTNVDSVSGTSSCNNYLSLKDEIANAAAYSALRADLPGSYPAPLGTCCGILKESIVCLSPSAVIGVVGGYLGLLMSIFQVLFIVLSKYLKGDVFQNCMGHYIVDDPFMDFRKHREESTKALNHFVSRDNNFVHHVVPNDSVENGVQMESVHGR